MFDCPSYPSEDVESNWNDKIVIDKFDLILVKLIIRLKGILSRDLMWRDIEL